MDFMRAPSGKTAWTCWSTLDVSVAPAGPMVEVSRRHLVTVAK